MKYPLDEQTLNEALGHVISHEKSQSVMIKLLTGLLIEAMSAADDDQADEDWYKEADKFLQFQADLKMDHDNRIFDEENLRKARGMLPKRAPPTMPHNIARAIAPIPEFKEIGTSTEGELSERDLAAHFSESPAKIKKEKKEKKAFKDMTLEEIEEWEKKQENSNDIYKVKARVANLARSGGGQLTDQGEMLCNTFVHVLKSLYDFAEKIEDKTVRINLIELIRKQEGMPANLIGAAGAGVRTKK